MVLLVLHSISHLFSSRCNLFCFGLKLNHLIFSKELTLRKIFVLIFWHNLDFSSLMRNHVVTEPCLTPMKTPALPCTRDAPWCRALSHIKPGTLATICPVNLIKNHISLHKVNQLIIRDGSFFDKIEIKFCYPIFPNSIGVK